MEFADRHRDQRSGPVADTVLAEKVAIDFVGRDLLLREQVVVGDEAGVIERDGARQSRIAFAPSALQENRHQFVILDRIDRAGVAVPNAEQKAAVAANCCTELAKQRRPERGNQSRLIDAIDQAFGIK